MRYKILTDDYGNGTSAGTEAELEMAPADEAEAIERGWLEPLPASYRVVGQQPVYEHARGETFTAALPAYQVAQLEAGGAIEPVKGKSTKADTPATSKERS